NLQNVDNMLEAGQRNPGLRGQVAGIHADPDAPKASALQLALHMAQQCGIEMLATISRQRGTVPDVRFARQETHAQIQPANQLLVKRDPAIGDSPALASSDIT